MPQYYHEHSVHKQHRFIRRSYVVILSILFVAAIGGLVIYYDNLVRNNSNTPESTTSEVTTSYFASSTRVFRTAYFQFQANKSWSEADTETAEGKFVYRSIRGSLIEHELVIYVDREPDDIPITRILPVTLIVNRSEFLTGEVSAHCGDDLPREVKVDGPRTIDGVTFNCAANDSRYTVMVGTPEGGTSITMQRPNGTQARYSIYYANLTAESDASQLIEIINTFQAR